MTSEAFHEDAPFTVLLADEAGQFRTELRQYPDRLVMTRLRSSVTDGWHVRDTIELGFVGTVDIGGNDD